jgi:acyl-CoA synthetase (AMP-forming)/AMP-acid ligase II
VIPKSGNRLSEKITHNEKKGDGSDPTSSNQTLEPARLDASRTLATLLAHRAATQADDRAYLFLSDRGSEEAALSFGELHRKAHALAARLGSSAAAGDRALLVFPPGLEFLVAFFACQVARVIAVPMMVPRRQSARDSSASIVTDCAPAVVLTTADLAARDDVRARLPGAMAWLAVDLASPDEAAPEHLALPSPDDTAFIQYTSGSTSAPRGVVVSHANFMANAEMIRIALGNTARSTHVNWVPLYHDMGLILNALQTFYLGALCVLMAPNAFMQRPLNWLTAVHRYGAEVICGPNFGFDLCVDRYRAEQMQDVDLAGLKVALNGAEPVHAETIARFAATFAPHGFDPHAAFPAYGMAEATLLISGGRRGAGPVTRAVSRAGLQASAVRAPADGDDTHVIVGCGRALAGEQIAIVDPDTRARLGADAIGEIWVRGANTARAYWRNGEASAALLNAAIAGEEGSQAWLRTGDLGFLDPQGEVFITGRLKDLIIIRGVNHYPQDIERTAERAHAALRRHGAAAFTLPDARDGEELVVVQEVERTARHHVDADELTGLIRERIAEEHEVFARHIVLIRPGTLPKTTSGKVQRRLTRQLWLDGKLDVLSK